MNLPGPILGSPLRTILVMAVVSLLATLWYPPVGAVLFIVTTVMACRRFRKMPVIASVLITATVIAIAAAPGAFLTPHTGNPAIHHGRATVPHAPPRQ